MLKSMRKNLKSLAPTLWFVIIAFIISIFAVWGGAGRLGEGGGTDTLVTVGKEKISVSVYYQTLRQRLEAMRQQYRDLDSQFIQQLNIPQQILNQLIQQSLLMQLSRDMGIEATDDEIRKKIMSYPAFQKDGQFIGFAQYQNGKSGGCPDSRSDCDRRGAVGKLSKGQRHREDRIRFIGIG
jgi:peptidyl-prolyl cis-trans isomerase D